MTQSHNPSQPPTVSALKQTIADQARTIEELTRREALYRSFFEKHHAVMLLIDVDAKVIVDANIAATQFYGYPLVVMRGMPVAQINATPEDKVAPQRQEAMLGKRNVFTFEHRLANQEIRKVESHISAIEHNNQRLFFSVIHDVTERYEAQQKMRELAFHDHLTGLPNRVLFYDRLKQALLNVKRKACYAALVLVDIDDFKSINDSFGHLAGDELLKQLADRMQACVREVDTVARYGGDEFVIVLHDLDADKTQASTYVTHIMTQLLDTLAHPYQFDAPSRQDQTCMQVCTVSMGVTLFNANASSEDTLMQSADEAMYQAKNAGKNTFVIKHL